MKKYWYKRIFFIDGKEVFGGYHEYTKEQVYKIRQSQEFDKNKGQNPMFSLQKSSIYYELYRWGLSNKKAIGSVLLVLLAAILAYFFTPKH